MGAIEGKQEAKGWKVTALVRRVEKLQNNYITPAGMQNFAILSGLDERVYGMRQEDTILRN